MARKQAGHQGATFKLTRGKMGRKHNISTHQMRDIRALTENQQKFFDAWDKGKHIFLYGSSGTGKTFIALYKALVDCLKETPSYESIYLVRSLVATREIGFLPGDHEDKSSYYQKPYKEMVKYMFELTTDESFDLLYENLKNQKTIKFWSTSFLRGLTIDNAVIIVDEMQNLNFHELDSIITRVGEGTRIVFCGDASQTDLTRTNEKNGIHDFMRILQLMPESFEMIEMKIEDICRSGLVKSYLASKNALGM